MSLYDKIHSRKQKNEHLEKQNEEVIKLIQKIRGDLLAQTEMNQFEGKEDKVIQEGVKRLLEDYLQKSEKFLPKDEKEMLVCQIVQDINGLGPIQSYLEDESVTEIMVNGPKQVYIERNGQLYLTQRKFINDEHVMSVIDKIISPLGRRIDESSPMVDARLQDGSRFNAIIPPLALNGPSLTIRKFSKKMLTMNQLVEYQSISSKMADFLEKAVSGIMNIIVAGGTGSGKTTLLNVLSSFIPTNERIITIEDAAELKLSQLHVVSLETRPPNIEGKGEITIRDLVRNSLRMRPDRIIVGEVRGGESLDMLQAMNTGHDGSLSTVHANSPRDVLSRLETLILMAGYDLPLKAIRQQIASSIDLIVMQRRFYDGSRKVTHITLVDGMEDDIITLQDLFVFKEADSDQRKITGEFVEEGVIPKRFRHGRKEF